jgi:inosine/xanthosine triphosphatase
MNIINICVGSLNPVKVNATKLAFKNYFKKIVVFKIKADSKIPNQPIGIDMIINGAKNRAKFALNYLINEKEISKNIFGIGIEAGLVPISNAISGYMDFQFCVIIDENQRITLGSGVSFEYPKSVIEQILEDRKKEIGEIIGKLAGNINLKNEAGAISFLSKKKINRTEILTHATICALLPRINNELY